jgi:hypothetical protein
MLFVNCIIVVKGMYLNLKDKDIINFHIAMMFFLHFKCVNIFSHFGIYQNIIQLLNIDKKKTF